MRVSRLVDGDWSFGHSKADYLTNSDAIKQNVQTRLLMFKNDYYLNIDLGIDWKNQTDQEFLLREVQKIVLQTTGVMSISKSSVDLDTERVAQITLTYTDFFNETIQILLEL